MIVTARRHTSVDVCRAKFYTLSMPKAMPYPLRLPGEMQQQIRDAARATHLEQSEVMRQSIRLGLPRLLESLGQTGPVVNVKPFPKGTLSKIYRKPDPGWDKVEAAATRAQGRPSFEE